MEPIPKALTAPESTGRDPLFRFHYLLKKQKDTHLELSAVLYSSLSAIQIDSKLKLTDYRWSQQMNGEDQFLEISLSTFARSQNLGHKIIRLHGVNKNKLKVLFLRTDN